MNSIVLIGAGGHSRSIIDLVESISGWEIYGLVGLPYQVGSLVLGYPVVGSDIDLPALRQDCQSAVLAIGQLPNPEPRMRLAHEIQKLGFMFPVLVSPNAVISRYAKLGSGTTVGHGVIVNAGAVVGQHCILNSRSLIEHDSIIGDHCHISTGALVNGSVRVGPGSFIGSGAMLRESIELPSSTVIGAGKRVMGWPLRD